MSSNAFARSRPRVRHQRVPKKECYAHPRFLQLVKELARLDDAKKKQEVVESLDESSTTKALGDTTTFNNGAVTDDCSNLIAPSNHNTASNHPNSNNNLNQTSTNSSSSTTATTQQQNVHEHNSRCGHSTNTCRLGNRLESNHASSTLNNTFYCQVNNDNQQTSNNSLHQNYQRLYGYPTSRYYDYSTGEHNIPMNNISHHLQPDYRCPQSKCSALPAAASNHNFGCSKSVSNDRGATNLSMNDPDPRQDENRTKRKRSIVDNGKKSSQPTSPSSCSKRHKTSPEPIRPLSPSFTKCPICLLDCMDRDPSFTNTCFHLFCYVCIENWSKSKATCPLCRTKFSKIIYNIRSASRFDEKVASPIRRDEDDDRIIYENLYANTIGSTRNSSSDDTRLLFDNLRNTHHNDGLIPHFTILGHSLNRNTLQSFNPVSPNSPFNGGVPHGPFIANGYNPVGSSYIHLIPSNDRSQATANGPAIINAYTTNTSLTNNGDASNRAMPRMSRSGRFIHTRNYDLTTVDSASRVSRATNTVVNPLSIEPRHHHHQMPHGDHHHHHNQHGSQQQHRSTSTIELVPPRQAQRLEQHQPMIPYLIPHRHYTNPHLYSRRPYTNPPPEPHIIENMYRQMPDM